VRPESGNHDALRRSERFNRGNREASAITGLVNERVWRHDGDPQGFTRHGPGTPSRLEVLTHRIIIASALLSSASAQRPLLPPTARVAGTDALGSCIWSQLAILLQSPHVGHGGGRVSAVPLASSMPVGQTVKERAAAAAASVRPAAGSTQGSSTTPLRLRCRHVRHGTGRCSWRSRTGRTTSGTTPERRSRSRSR
jgi:hypothetical protein